MLFVFVMRSGTFQINGVRHSLISNIVSLHLQHPYFLHCDFLHDYCGGLRRLRLFYNIIRYRESRRK